jgi:hypothetical protein
VVETVRNRQAGFLTNFETFLVKKLKYVNTSWRAANNWSEGRMRPAGRQLDSPALQDWWLEFIKYKYCVASSGVIFAHTMFSVNPAASLKVITREITHAHDKNTSLYPYDTGKLPKSYHLTLFSPPKPHYKVFLPPLICNVQTDISAIFSNFFYFCKKV